MAERMTEAQARLASQQLQAWSPHFVADAQRMDQISDQIRELLNPPPGTPGNVHPKFNLRVMPLTALVPGGLLQNTNWIEISGNTEFNPDGSTKRIDMICLQMRAPANRAGYIIDSNYGSAICYAMCDRPGILVRNGSASAGQFGAPTYGSQQWNTQPGDQPAHDFVADRDYWLCMAHFDLAHWNATGDVRSRIDFDGRRIRPWNDRFIIQVRA